MKAHLDKYWDKISIRADQGDTPYNLRNCAYLKDFDKQKIMYAEIVQKPKFYLDKNGEFYPEATTFILTGEHVDYLERILNSNITHFIFETFYAGGGLGEHGTRYKKVFLENLPIPKPNKESGVIDDKYILSMFKSLTQEELDYILSRLRT